MHSRHQQKSPKPRYGRYRALARSLSRRVYVTHDGRLQLVGGEPDYHALLACLNRQKTVQPAEKFPTPEMLGFQPGCDGEVTPIGLQSRSHALTKWDHCLQTELRRARPGKLRVRQITTELADIAALRERLAELYQTRRRLGEQNKNDHEPLWLPQREEQWLENRLNETQSRSQLPQLVCQFARLVLWSNGRLATLRYLDALTPLATSTEEIEEARRLRRLIRQLHTWKKRLLVERRLDIHVEIVVELKALPTAWLEAAGLTSRLRGRTVEVLCDTLIERAEQRLIALGEIPRRRIPAAIAALVMCDNSRVPLPAKLISNCLKNGKGDEFQSAITGLHAEHQRPGYDHLLRAIDQPDHQFEVGDYGLIRQLFADGANLQDVTWAEEAGWLWLCRVPGLTPAWMQQTLSRLNAKGVALDSATAEQVFSAMTGPKDIAVLNDFVRWVERFSNVTITARVSKQIVRALLDLILPAFAGLVCHAELAAWARRESQAHHVDLLGDARLQPITRQLKAIAFYQKLAARQPALPKSIARLLKQAGRKEGERAFLQAAVDDGRATAGQLARLAHLACVDHQDNRVSKARLQRTAEELLATIAIDALRERLHTIARQKWQTYTDAPMPNCSLSTCLALGKWAGSMEPTYRAALRQILAAHQAHGPTYKGRLAANRRWLTDAEGRGLNRSAWLGSSGRRQNVDGRDVIVAVEHDPFEVFFMGTFFNTCLSLGNCNELSVLANAMDANKQVLYMRDGEGHVLSRQLIAVSSNMQLIGYHCYAGVEHDKADIREHYIAAMADFAGRLAMRSGLTLADAGEPDEISGLFWYNDGEHHWHKAAKQGWHAERDAARSKTPVQQKTDDVSTEGLAAITA